MTTSRTGLYRGLLVVVVVLVALGAGAWLLTASVRHARRSAALRESQVTAPESGYPFPAASEIARMTISYWDRERRKDVSPFDAPEHCWEDILHSLTPSQHDPPPNGAWKVLGEMDIELANGGRCHVELYDVGVDPYCPDVEPLGAFSAGPDRESREYYRGGYTTRLKAAMERAFSESQERVKPLAAPGSPPD